MSQLSQLFNALDISKETVKDIVATLMEDPLAAMEKVQKLNISPDILQQITQIVLLEPGAIDELAREIGITEAEYRSD